MERIADASRQVAVPAADVRAEPDEHGRIVLRRRRFGPGRAAIARMLRLPVDFTMHLDALGSEAWALLDGRRTIGEMHAALAVRRPGELDLAARLGKFLSAMVSRKMIELR